MSYASSLVRSLWHRRRWHCIVGAAVAGVAQTTGIREVTASDRSVIPLQTRLRYTTMIVLPDGEEILDVICGDKDFWVISAVQNIAHVKPAKAGAETNLNLVTAQRHDLLVPADREERHDRARPEGLRERRPDGAARARRSTTAPPRSSACRPS